MVELENDIVKGKRIASTTNRHNANGTLVLYWFVRTEKNRLDSCKAKEASHSIFFTETAVIPIASVEAYRKLGWRPSRYCDVLATPMAKDKGASHCYMKGGDVVVAKIDRLDDDKPIYNRTALTFKTFGEASDFIKGQRSTTPKVVTLEMRKSDVFITSKSQVAEAYKKLVWPVERAEPKPETETIVEPQHEVNHNDDTLSIPTDGEVLSIPTETAIDKPKKVKKSKSKKVAKTPEVRIEKPTEETQDTNVELPEMITLFFEANDDLVGTNGYIGQYSYSETVTKATYEQLYK